MNKCNLLSGLFVDKYDINKNSPVPKNIICVRRMTVALPVLAISPSEENNLTSKFLFKKIDNVMNKNARTKRFFLLYFCIGLDVMLPFLPGVKKATM